MTDEIDFQRLAEAISFTGRPVYYRGEGGETTLGTYHPPLYAYALALWTDFFGSSIQALRSFGAATALGTAAAGVWALRSLRLPTASQLAFVALFLLHPFVVHSSLLLDIDGTVLPLTTMLLIAAAAKHTTGDWSRRRGILVLSAAVCAVLYSKLPGALAFPLALGILLAQLRPRDAVADFAAALAAGSAAFLALWSATVVITRTDFLFPFTFLLFSGTKGGVLGTPVTELVDRLQPAPLALGWIGFALPLLAVAASVAAARSDGSRLHRALPGLCTAWAAGVYLFYSLLGSAYPWFYPKYFAVMMPALCFALAVAVRRAPPRLDVKRLFALGVALLAVLVPVMVWAYPMEAPFYEVTPSGMTRGHVIILLLVLAASVAARVWRAWDPWAAVVAATALGNVALLCAIAATTPSPRYYPAEESISAVIAATRQRAAPNVPVLAPKDIGSATFNRYFEMESLVQHPVRFEQVVKRPDVQVAVIRKNWDHSLFTYPYAEAVLDRYMDLDWENESFAIYTRPSDPEESR